MKARRRQILQAALVPLLAPLWSGSTPAWAALPPEISAIKIIQDQDIQKIQKLAASKDFDQVLARAVLSFLRDNYSTGKVPVWNKPMAEIDFQPRITAIANHVVTQISKHMNIYPVDPCWIMAQILAESFFYEFAVSSALAVGPCQFIAPTARGYQMVCADEHLLAHHEVQHPELHSSFELASELNSQLRTLRKENPDLFSNTSSFLRTILKQNAQGEVVYKAQDYLDIFDQGEQIQKQYAFQRDQAQQFLRANFQNRSIFNAQDKVFLAQFDQRVLYEFSIPAMIQMMAENLRARGGNILTATAGYNAGLGNTKTQEKIYSTYGRLPNFSETITYVSRIVVNHHEIMIRL